MTTITIDCGATRTKLAAITDGTATFHTLDGFNPRHGDWMEYSRKLKNGLNAKSPIGQLIFYGAGIGTEQLQFTMKQRLAESLVVEGPIQVYSDQLACAHAAFDEAPVIVAILGTGSNVGHYDGTTFTQETRSYGYLLGDEGSGFDIGRQILRAYIYNQLPAEAIAWLKRRFNLSYEFILNTCYDNNGFRQLCAQLAPVASEYKSEPVLNAIVRNSIARFIELRLMPEVRQHPTVNEVHFFGSISSTFESTLTEEIVRSGLNISIVARASPLHAIVDKMIDK